MKDSRVARGPSVTTRREILKYAGLGMGAAAVSALGVTVNAEANEAQAPTKPAQTEVTDKSGKRLAAGAEIAWTKVAKKAAAADVTVDPTKTAQTMLGFGAAFTDAACFTLSRLSDSDRASLLHTMFGKDQHALGVGRIAIGASDYSTAAYSYDDGAADPELKRFSIDHDRDYVLPTLRAALSANADLFLYGSPWSPPGWMKYGNSMLGGNIRPENIPPYARYLQKFVEAYAAAGVNVRAVTPQNEIDADQGGKMPACPWPQEDEERLVTALGPLLEASGTKIWMLDHNYNLWGRVLDQLCNPRYKKYVNTVAWHGYLGSPEMMEETTTSSLTIGRAGASGARRSAGFWPTGRRASQPGIWLWMSADGPTSARSIAAGWCRFIPRQKKSNRRAYIGRWCSMRGPFAAEL